MFEGESIFSIEVDLANQLQGALLQNEKLVERIKLFERENTWLIEQINSLKRGKYRSKSERWETEEQGCLFNEAEVESGNPDVTKDENEIITVKGHKKKRGHRKGLPKDLAREVVKVELPEAERVSEEGLPLKIIGWEVSEKVKYEPAKMSVIEYHRAKYGVESGDYVKTAPPVPSIIPKGIVTPELLAAIIVGKYADGMPLYRMESMFARHDLEISRGTMARWVVKAAEALQPVLNVLNDRLLLTHYVACDETALQVLKENGRRAEQKSWMIVRSTPGEAKKIIIFDYSVSRSSAVMEELFADYKGVLQTDGLNSYGCLESENVFHIGCNMHARRRFEHAAKDGAAAGKSLGAQGLKFYKQIYDLEEELKERASEERERIRKKISGPIFAEMKLWAETNQRKVPDKSKIGKAFSYFLSEYEYLTGYLKCGLLNPDNGFTERAIRKFAIGRNNWLFADTPEGAQASALLYSVIVTAKVNGANVYRALTKILTELPLAKTCDDYERLADLILAP